MMARDVHAAWRTLPIVLPADVSGGEPFVVVSPHPDDESLGLGGLIAASCEARVDVRVVMVSDGSQSHPTSRRFPRDRLVALRRAEADAAALELGLDPRHITHLDLPDAAVPVEGVVFDAAVAHLAAVVDESRAAAVFVTWEHDPHCDHEAAAVMVKRLRAHRPGLRCWFYPIWGWHIGDDVEVGPPPLRGARIDIASWHAAKERAIAAHVSQMTGLIDDDPSGFRFTPEQLAPFLQPFETVFEIPA